MPGSSRLDELYGADPRGRIPRPRRGRVWSWAVGLACLVGLAVAGYQLRAQWWAFYDDVVGFPARQVTLTGRVVDAETGRGVPGAHLELRVERLAFFRRGLNGDWFTAQGTTSATGEFRFRAHWAEMPRLTVKAAGYRDTTLTLRRSATLDVQLSPLDGAASP